MLVCVCVCACVCTCMWLHMGEMRGESGHPISSFGSTSSLCHVLKPFDLTDEWTIVQSHLDIANYAG